MTRVEISAQAKADLLGIWEHIAAKDVAAADRVYARLMDRMRIAELFQDAGAPRPDLHPHGRVLVEEPYLICYRPVGRGLLRVARVLHGARRIGPAAFR